MTVTLHKLFTRDEVARVVDREELPVVSSDATTYGLAMIVDKNFNVIYHAQKGDAPRPVGEGEYTLIATNELLRINFLSGVPNNDNKRAAGIHLDPIKEADKVTGKEHTARLRATLEFKIDRHNREVADEILALMQERNCDTLTKKQLLKDLGADLKEHMQNFVQTAVDDVGMDHLSEPEIQNREAQSMGPVMSKMGLIFGDIVINPDKRSAWQRLILPSPNYDYRWVLALKLVIPVVTTTASALIALYGIGVFEQAPVLTIGDHTNGAVNIIEVDCESSAECSVSRGNDLSLSVKADEGYKLVELHCSGECPENLTPADTVKVENIRGDFTLTPDFQPAGEINIETLAGDAECTSISDGYKGTSCLEVSGGKIKLTVNEEIPIDAQSIGVFESWDCDDPVWCEGADLRSAAMEITVPQELGTLSISPIFRTHNIVTIKVRPSEPSEANVAKASVKDGCLAAENCRQSAEGQVDLYTFQVPADEPPPTITLTAPNPRDPDSLYQLVSWDCEPASCEVRGSEVDLTLSDNIAVRGVYAEQNVFTVLNATSDNIDFGQISLPSEGCETAPPHIRCVFGLGDSIEVSILPNFSDTERRFTGWMCQGAPCAGTPFVEARGATPSDAYRQTLSDSVTITPTFHNIIFTVLTTYDDALGGSVSADCERTDDCRREEGWMTSVTASADSGYRFVSWDCTGDSCPSSRTSNPLRLILDSDVTVTPIFEEIPKVKLTIGASVNGRATADCGSDCNRELGWRTSVTARPERGWRFLSWDCTGESCPSSLTSDPLRLTLNDDVTLIPIFEEIPTATLTIGSARNGSATADCGSECDREIGWRTTVTATPNDGYRFASWDCSGSCPSGSARARASITINEDTNITPIFEEIPRYTITVGANTGGSARVNGQNCSNGCRVREGTSVTITASSSSSRYNFDEWSGDSSSSSNSITVEVTRDLRYTANFVIDRDRLTVKVDGEGSVSTSEGNCNSGTCRFNVDDGTRVTLTARADSGYYFERWSGAVSGSSASNSITVTRNSDVTAVFKRRAIHCDGGDVRNRNIRYPDPVQNEGQLVYLVKFDTYCDTVKFDFQTRIHLGTDWDTFSVSRSDVSAGSFVEFGYQSIECSFVQKLRNLDVDGTLTIDGRSFDRKRVVECR